MARTVHVLPTDKGWAVIREGSGENKAYFPTLKQAVATARTKVKKNKSGQVAIHRKNGGVTITGVIGLPKIHKSPVKSSIGSEEVRRAVSSLVRERLANLS